MKRKATNLIAMVALLAFAAAGAMACPLVYTINFSGQFGIMDLATGAFTPIGKGLENTPDGIAGKPGGPFYTVDGTTGHLLRIGNDGKVTDIGDTHTGPNVGPSGISLVGSLTDGTLYALDFSNRLYKINEKTAALTLVGFIPALPVQEPEYIGNMVTSLNGTADKLYFTIEISEGPLKVGPNLYTIDPSNLSVVVNSLKLTDRVIGSGFANGQYYLFGAGGDIIKVDPGTRDAAVVAEYDSGAVDDGPPFTGIFGAIAPVEPYALAKPATPVKPTKRDGPSYWPSRLTARPPHTCQ